MKTTIIIIGGIFAIVATGFFSQGTDLAMKKFFDPKYEAVRRETFEQSKAYNQGMIQELQNMQFEYIKASPEHKTALKSIILHRAADYPMDDAPVDLRNFIRELRNSY